MNIKKVRIFIYTLSLTLLCAQTTLPVLDPDDYYVDDSGELRHFDPWLDAILKAGTGEMLIKGFTITSDGTLSHTNKNITEDLQDKANEDPSKHLIIKRILDEKHQTLYTDGPQTLKRLIACFLFMEASK